MGKILDDSIDSIQESQAEHAPNNPTLMSLHANAVHCSTSIHEPTNDTAVAAMLLSCHGLLKLCSHKKCCVAGT